MLRSSRVDEPEDPAVLEEAPHDAENPHRLRQPLHPGAQAAQPADVEPDGYARPARVVELVDDLGVLELVHLRVDTRRPPRPGMLRLAANELDEAPPHRHRGHEQLAVLGVGDHPGQRVEDGGDVVADRLVAGQQPDVLVDPGRSRVVVPGADVRVAPHAVRLVAHDEGELDVGLEPLHPVGHVHAFLLEEVAPRDVRGLVEPRRDLDEHRHLLALPRSFRERLQQRRVAAGPVDRQLYREHRGIGRGGVEEPQHGGVEALVGVVQQDVAARDLVEDRRGAVRQPVEPGVNDRLVRRMAQIVAARPVEALEVAHAEGRPRRIDVVGADPELAAQPRHLMLRHGAVHLQPDHPREPPGLQLRAHLPDDAAGFRQRRVAAAVGLVDVALGRARDAEHVDRGGPRAGIQQVEVGGDDLLDGHDAGTVLQGNPPRAVAGHLDAHEAGVAVVRNEHREIEPEVADERERMLRIDGERGQYRLDVAREVGAQGRAFVPFQVVVPQDGQPRPGEVRHQLLVPQAAELRHLAEELGAAGGQLLGRRPAVDRDLLGPVVDLALEAAHALHEELVVEHPDDARELDALEQGQIGAADEVQHPAGEPQPAQLSAQKRPGRSKGGEAGSGRHASPFDSAARC